MERIFAVTVLTQNSLIFRSCGPVVSRFPFSLYLLFLQLQQEVDVWEVSLTSSIQIISLIPFGYSLQKIIFGPGSFDLWLARETGR